MCQVSTHSRGMLSLNSLQNHLVCVKNESNSVIPQNAPYESAELLRKRRKHNVWTLYGCYVCEQNTNKNAMYTHFSAWVLGPIYTETFSTENANFSLRFPIPQGGKIIQHFMANYTRAFIANYVTMCFC